jgi:hypothetical protein
MDEIGSYIKYIIIAVIIAFRFFAGSKKKEQLPNKGSKSAKRSSTTKSTSSLEDILRELSGETSAKPVPKPAAKVKPTGNKIEIEDHQYDFRPEYEHHADTELDLTEVRAEIRQSQGLGRIEIEKEYSEVEFDLRQAIISQTILTRPQY